MQMPLFRNAVQHADTAHRKLSRLFSVVWYDLSWRFAPPGTFRQRFEQAIVNMPQGICLYDAQDRLQLVNEQFCRLYGQPMETLHMGMRFYDILANSCSVGNYPGRTVEEIYRERKAHIAPARSGLVGLERTLGVIADGQRNTPGAERLHHGGFLTADR